MRQISTITIIVILVAIISACSDRDSGKTFEFPDFDLTIKTIPEILLVGEDAEISVLVTDQEHSVIAGCTTRFRQFMPGMEMSQDHTYFNMNEVKKGTYQGRSGEFSMGGDWVIEFDINCQNNTHTVQIPYYLEWPE